MSQAAIQIRRRPARSTPLSRLRLGAAPRSGAATVAFPGIGLPEPERRGRKSLAALVSGGVHVAAVVALLAIAWLAPPPEEEEIIPIELVEVKPPPPPPPPPVVQKRPEPPPTPVAKAPPPPQAAPKPVPAPPPPAPKALAERRSVNFEPAAQAVAPQIVNPAVVQKASPTLDAKRLDVKALESVAAPREIQAASVAVQTVEAVTSVSAPSSARQIDVGQAAAPALRGPVLANAPAGASVGPKAIAAAGNSVGTGTVVRSGDGSSVREGVVTGRDVLGSPDGERLANVNTGVGQGNLRGPGGEGTTLGGGASDCDARPEVRAYQEQIRQRTLARWVAPPSMQQRAKATLSWQLDVSGSATGVKLVNASTNAIGSSVVDALRAASPFPPMSDRVRCLANRRLTGTFSLTPEG